MNVLKTAAAVLLCAAPALMAPAQILYKVTAPKTGTESYLLGTHHFAPLSTVEELPGLAAIVEGCGRLYGELDMSGMQSPEAMMQMQAAMMAPTDSTLSVVIGKAQADSVAQALSGLTGMNMPASGLEPLKPAAMGMQLTQLLSMKANPGFDISQNIDMVMQQKAREAGKEVLGLETLADQIDVLFNAPLSDQGVSLMETVRDIEGKTKESAALVEAYVAHDISRIAKMMDDAYAEDPAAADRLINARNYKWVKILDSVMPDTPVMVVVGIGHLPGEKGMIESLKKLGYSVTAVD